MAEKNINDNKNNQSSGSNPFNSLKGKDGKPKFNFYWIYGILFVILIGLQFIGLGGEGKQTDWRDLKYMLENDDVSKIVLVNKEKSLLTISVKSKGKFDQKISDVEIIYDKNLDLIKKKIFFAYNKAKYYKNYNNEIFDILDKKYTYLSELNIELIKHFTRILNLKNLILLIRKNLYFFLKIIILIL